MKTVYFSRREKRKLEQPFYFRTVERSTILKVCKKTTKSIYCVLVQCEIGQFFKVKIEYVIFDSFTGAPQRSSDKNQHSDDYIRKQSRKVGDFAKRFDAF